MTESLVATAAAGIEEVLAGSGLGDVLVNIVDVASAGATRSTLYIDITQGGVETSAVAQIRAITSNADLAEAQTEGALLRLAGGAGVATPNLLGAGHSDLLDAEVLITGRVEGETIPRRVLRLLAKDPQAGKRLTAQCGEALAKLHTIDQSEVVTAVPHIGAVQDPGSYLAKLEESLDELGHPYPTFRYGLRYLESAIPDQAPSVVLVHGDFRNGNLIVDDSGLAAVLDWELTHLGDPMEDLAWLCLRFWRFGDDKLPVGGFGAIEDLKAAYTNAGGFWRPDAFEWWTMARTIWWGQGLAGQAKRFSNGESTSIVHAASGRRVVELEYDLLNLIGEPRGF